MVVSSCISVKNGRIEFPKKGFRSSMSLVCSPCSEKILEVTVITHPGAARKMEPHAAQTTVWCARQKMMLNIPTTLQSFLQMKDSLPANPLTADHGHFRTADNEISCVHESAAAGNDQALGYYGIVYRWNMRYKA
ncbi:hypothetical protein PV328_001260 [Microctonus aethiopoides]|uniref:Uncharacterized protein n=1 Tax=Microctonus aethiopoides TaxID=144406 RepID=A0AA39FWU1_9HYME|nr:hypothetical protein PV328_001260 [Microctonus aethiopoides]